MPDQWSELTIYDGDFSVAEACGIPSFVSPIAASTNEYVFSQPFMQARKDFVPTPLNTAHPSAGMTPDYSAYVLVAEGPRQDLGGGIVRWTRTYAKVPDNHDEFESYGYPFIGFAGTWTKGNRDSVVNASGRPRQAHVANSKVRHEYFLTGPGTSYPSPGNIPQLRAQKYYGGLLDGLSFTVALYGHVETDFVADAFPAPPVTATVSASSPSRTQYLAWMDNARSLGFSGDEVTSWMGPFDSGTTYPIGATVDNGGTIQTLVALAGGGTTWKTLSSPSQFLAEDSRLVRWHGNIFMRASRFVLAQ